MELGKSEKNSRVGILMVNIDRFIEDFLKEIKEENAAIFAGAGLSAPVGFVNWQDLLRPLAEDIHLDVEREHDLVALAQYHVNEHQQNRYDLNRAILDNFSRTVKITENHKILARLPIKTYWTTNYDTLIEDALKEAGKRPDVKHTTNQLPQTLPNRDAVVYKMHGDVHHPFEAVLTKSDYETYHKDRGPFITALAGDLVNKTFLFLGFSFSDPNLDYILSRMRYEQGENQRKHYCILKKESPKESDVEGDFEYRKVKQQLFIHDLLRYNIRTILVDEYTDITNILTRLDEENKQKTIFISGAAHEYGDNWTEKDALEFVHSLSAKLIANNHQIVTGLGLGIGSAVVDGALQEIYWNQKQTLTDQIVIRPFPQTEQAQMLWKQYRDDMLNYAGTAIFMFGNKINKESGEIVLSDGMRDEFEIARDKGINIIPLGFTGYMAKELWNEVKDNFDQYYPDAPELVEQAFLSLGNTNLTQEEHIRFLQTILDNI